MLYRLQPKKQLFLHLQNWKLWGFCWWSRSCCHRGWWYFSIAGAFGSFVLETYPVSPLVISPPSSIFLWRWMISSMMKRSSGGLSLNVVRCLHGKNPHPVSITNWTWLPGYSGCSTWDVEDQQRCSCLRIFALWPYCCNQANSKLVSPEDEIEYLNDLRIIVNEHWTIYEKSTYS